MKKIVFSSLLILIFVLLMVPLCFAPGGLPPGPPPPPPNPTAPIDGGLGFLLAAGLIYGVHRYKKSRKR